MPELIEVEVYRRAAEAALGRRVAKVVAPDAWFLKGVEAHQVREAILGEHAVTARRRGKLLMVDFSNGAVLGLRFGMTGRLLVDGDASIERLEYSSGRNDPAWDRFGLDFADGGRLRLRDPRRLGGIELEPDLDALGPDGADIGVADLRLALGKSTAPLKARLLDQSRIAGLGNLLVDETLWRCGISPERAAGSLDADESVRLARSIRSTVRALSKRGGSHTGDLQEQRHRDGVCPQDGEPLRRDKVGGRTTYWCAEHQL